MTTIVEFYNQERKIVDLSSFEDLIYKIVAKTGTTPENALEIARLIFEETINAALDNKIIDLGFGRFSKHFKFARLVFKLKREIYNQIKIEYYD